MAEEVSGIVVTQRADGIMHILIDRAEQANALSPLARDTMADAILRAHSDPVVRAVLLTAAGERHFCTGAGLAPHAADASARQTAVRRPGDVARMLAQGWQRLIGAVLDCDKPVVAAVRGTAAGAGASLLLACDLVIMSTGAKLVETFVRRGILPDAGSVYLLARLVGLRRATELLMLGEPVDATTCESLGLVNRAVADADTEPLAEQWAARLAAGPTVALGLTKRLLSVSSESSRERAFEQEAWAQEVVSRTADMQEGLASFAERRQPRFQGL